MKPNDTINHVLNNGLCIGCGACAFATEREMRETDTGFFEPDLPDDAVACPTLATVCPFSNLSNNEDQISSELFGNDFKKDPFIGNYLALHTGHSYTTRKIYGEPTSGGMITWVLHELLETGYVDYAIHAKEVSDSNTFDFKFGITDGGREDLVQKSKYFPTEMSEVLKSVMAMNGSAVFVGLPCQVKAIRLLQNHEPELKEKIKLCIGLVCGHLKSKRYADYLAAECSERMNTPFKSIDFRYRKPGADMADYDVRIETDDDVFLKPTKQIYASGWQYNLFRNSACDYCDDVFSETADLAVGDVWLDRYRNKEHAHSLLVVRNQYILKLLHEGSNRDDIELDDISPQDASLAQAGGLRDRRTYLAERLRENEKTDGILVKKRVAPARKEIKQLSEKVRLRAEIATISHEAWLQATRKADIHIFYEQMEPIKHRLDALGGDQMKGFRAFTKKALPKSLVSFLHPYYSKLMHFRRI